MNYSENCLNLSELLSDLSGKYVEDNFYEDAFKREKYLKSRNGKMFLAKRLKSYLNAPHNQSQSNEFINNIYGE